MADWRECVSEDYMMSDIVDKGIIREVERFVTDCMRKGLHTIEEIRERWRGRPLTEAQFVAYIDRMLYERKIGCVSGTAWWYVNESDKSNQREIEW